MPDGSCVIKYEGQRGVVWRIKYRDAAGKQVMETLGPAREGWTKRKAEADPPEENCGRIAGRQIGSTR